MEKFSGLTETEIISLAKEGNNEASTFIITKYRSVVEMIALKYTAFPIETEDLIQEGTIGLLAAIKSFSSEKGASFNTYCSTCINNSIQTALRKFSRKKDIPPDSLLPLEEEVVDRNSISVLSAEDSFLARESVSILTKQLDKNLSDFENVVLRLHMFGCSYAEIAMKLNKSPKAIDNALQRIRKKLKEVSF